MKVHRVRADVNNYQCFQLDDVDVGFTEMMTFDGTLKADSWIAPEVFILKPRYKKGNFPLLWGTPTLTVDETAFEQLADLLEMSGELLPLPYKDSMYHVLNVIECVNVLDEKTTRWLYGPGSGPIKTYSFLARRFTETPLFQIPETCKIEILTIEGMKHPDDEFKGRVERLGLKGLIFEELWSDERES